MRRFSIDRQVKPGGDEQRNHTSTFRAAMNASCGMSTLPDPG
jgi:hypothetical protein